MTRPESPQDAQAGLYRTLPLVPREPADVCMAEGKRVQRAVKAEQQMSGCPRPSLMDLPLPQQGKKDSFQSGCEPAWPVALREALHAYSKLTHAPTSWPSLPTLDFILPALPLQYLFYVFIILRIVF